MNHAFTRPVVAVLSALALASCVSLSNTVPSAADFSAAYERGMQYLKARQYKEAKVELTKAKPFQTGDTRALMALAVAADMQGDFRTSDRAYAELMLRQTDQAALFNNMGYSYMLRGDLDKALTYLSEAARRKPDDPTIQNNLKMLRGVAPLQ